MTMLEPTMVEPRLGAVFSSLSAEAVVVAARVRAGVVVVRGRGGGQGSGVIWHEDGVVLTNDHVVAQDEAQVILEDGREFVTTVFRRDPARDLAALRLPVRWATGRAGLRLAWPPVGRAGHRGRQSSRRARRGGGRHSTGGHRPERRRWAAPACRRWCRPPWTCTPGTPAGRSSTPGEGSSGSTRWFWGVASRWRCRATSLASSWRPTCPGELTSG